MCSPQVMEEVASRVTRRGFLGMLGAAAVVGASCAPVRDAQAPAQEDRDAKGSELKVQDLTHTVSPEFPVFPSYEPMEITQEFTIERNGSYANRLNLIEHTGTHMDAPFHFAADGLTADRIPIERFFAPLAVIDISERAMTMPGSRSRTSWPGKRGTDLCPPGPSSPCTPVGRRGSPIRRRS